MEQTRAVFRSFYLVDEVDPKYGEGLPTVAGWTGYTWNRKYFPEPEAFTKWLHDNGFRVTLNTHPADGIRPFEEIYPKVAEAMGVDPASEKTIEFDVTDPEFLDVYFNVLCRDLEKKGNDFWWIDWQHGSKSKIPGLDPLWVLNHYHYLDSSNGMRPMIFSRYAEVGSHRYPIGFSGDTHITWESLDYQVYFTATASNIGYGWWSHDIGGFKFGARDDELMARWTQFGVFSPIMRLRGGINPFVGKEPWRYNAATRQVMNRYLRLRHGMIPYLYTMNRRAHAENRPLMLPVYYMEPEREEAYQVPNEYYFGTELIVAPITQPGSHTAMAGMTKAWLPEGIWADFFTGMIYQGGSMVEMWREIEYIPVLMKAGAIVSLRNLQETDNSIANPSAMEIRIFPASVGMFTLWEDDGESVEDKPENWASTEMQINVDDRSRFLIKKATGNLSVIPEARSWKLVFVSTKECQPDVYVDGNRIEVKISCDKECNGLVVEIPETDVTKEIVVDFGTALTLEDKSLDECWFRSLERAQVGYLLKSDLYKTLLEDPAKAEETIQRTEMDESVKACLLEAVFSKKSV